MFALSKVVVFCFVCLCWGFPAIGLNPQPDSEICRPTSACWNETAEKLLIGNQNGTIVVIDTESNAVVQNHSLGEWISDVAVVDSEKSLFAATDFKNGKLICFQLTDSGLSVVWETKTCKYPNSIAVDPKTNSLVVSGLWSRQLTLVRSVSESGSGIETKTLDLGFNPGQMAWAPTGQLIVADAFGQSLAACILSPFSISGQVEMTGHRTGGLVVDPSRGALLLSDQKLNPLARANRNDVHWGLIIANGIRTLPLDSLQNLDGQKAADLNRSFSSYPVGIPGDAKADLGSMAISSTGKLAVTIGGADQVAIGEGPLDGFAFVNVGQRPIAVCISHDGKRVYVANQMSDSVSVVDAVDFDTTKTIALTDNKVTSLVEQGRRLFYSGGLSHDGWMSCHSCHVEGHTSGMLIDNQSDGSFGTPKRIFSLLGHGETTPLAWNGSLPDIESQVRKSIEVTMQSDDPVDEAHVAALTAFVKSLPAPPSLSAARARQNRDAIESGKKLFAELNCNQCHQYPQFTSEQQFDVGLKDEKGLAKFNPPSLIGAGQRKLFFHDGRATSITDVVTKFEHQIPRPLSPEEMSDLIEFLKSL